MPLCPSRYNLRGGLCHSSHTGTSGFREQPAHTKILAKKNTLLGEFPRCPLLPAFKDRRVTFTPESCLPFPTIARDPSPFRTSLRGVLLLRSQCVSGSAKIMRMAYPFRGGTTLRVSLAGPGSSVSLTPLPSPAGAVKPLETLASLKHLACRKFPG